MSEREKAMTIGVKDIDEQHKGLFMAIKKLNTAMSSGDVDSSVRETINFLEDYINRHFNDEEELQRNIGYDKYEEHSNQHRALVLEFAKKKNELLGMKKVDGRFVLELQSWLGKWLREHILGSDMKIGEYMKKNNIKL